MRRVLTSVVASFACACALLAGPSHMKDGRLFVSGDVVYDGFFREVHGLQREVPRWAEQRKAARAPLFEKLKLDPLAPDATAAQLTHDRAIEIVRTAGPLELDTTDVFPHVVARAGRPRPPEDETFLEALEETVHKELDRAVAMKEIPARCDVLIRRGEELEPRVHEVFGKQSTQMPYEVRVEVKASVEALTTIRDDAKRSAQGAADFVKDLQRAILVASTTGAADATLVPPVKEPKDAKDKRPPKPEPSARPAPSASARPAAASAPPRVPPTQVPATGVPPTGMPPTPVPRTETTPPAPRKPPPAGSSVPVAATPSAPKPAEAAKSAAPPPKKPKKPAEEVFNP